jgi:transcriptional antiterminator NusG
MDSVMHSSASAQWVALWTHANCEQLVHSQLVAKHFDAFLPMMPMWSRRGGVRHVIQVPMFPGYLFVRHQLTKASCIEILKTRGLTRVLGDRWDRPGIVSDEEMAVVQRIMHTKVPVLSHPYLQEGQRVRITQGPLADVEGIFVHGKPNKGLLVLSVHLLHRSVAVEVDCTLVSPVLASARYDGAACGLAH